MFWHFLLHYTILSANSLSQFRGQVLIYLLQPIGALYFAITACLPSFFPSFADGFSMHDQGSRGVRFDSPILFVILFAQVWFAVAFAIYFYFLLSIFFKCISRSIHRSTFINFAPSLCTFICTHTLALTNTHSITERTALNCSAQFNSECLSSLLFYSSFVRLLKFKLFSLSFTFLPRFSSSFCYSFVCAIFVCSIMAGAIGGACKHFVLLLLQVWCERKN